MNCTIPEFTKDRLQVNEVKSMSFKTVASYRSPNTLDHSWVIRERVSAVYEGGTSVMSSSPRIVASPEMILFRHFVNSRANL